MAFKSKKKKDKCLRPHSCKEVSFVFEAKFLKGWNHWADRNKFKARVFHCRRGQIALSSSSSVPIQPMAGSLAAFFLFCILGFIFSSFIQQLFLSACNMPGPGRSAGTVWLVSHWCHIWTGMTGESKDRYDWWGNRNGRGDFKSDREVQRGLAPGVSGKVGKLPGYTGG